MRFFTIIIHKPSSCQLNFTCDPFEIWNIYIAKGKPQTDNLINTAQVGKERIMGCNYSISILVKGFTVMKLFL